MIRLRNLKIVLYVLLFCATQVDLLILTFTCEVADEVVLSSVFKIVQLLVMVLLFVISLTDKSCTGGATKYSFLIFSIITGTLMFDSPL